MGILGRIPVKTKIPGGSPSRIYGGIFFSDGIPAGKYPGWQDPGGISAGNGVLCRILPRSRWLFYKGDTISVSSNRSLITLCGSISLHNLYTGSEKFTQFETASTEKSIVHTSMSSSLLFLASECFFRTSSNKRTFLQCITIRSFHSFTTLSKSRDAFFFMFFVVLGWLARPNLLKQSISSVLQSPRTKMVLIRNVK